MTVHTIIPDLTPIVFGIKYFRMLFDLRHKNFHHAERSLLPDPLTDGQLLDNHTDKNTLTNMILSS